MPSSSAHAHAVAGEFWLIFIPLYRRGAFIPLYLAYHDIHSFLPSLYSFWTSSIFRYSFHSTGAYMLMDSPGTGAYMPLIVQALSYWACPGENEFTGNHWPRIYSWLKRVTVTEVTVTLYTSPEHSSTPVQHARCTWGPGVQRKLFHHPDSRAATPQK